MAASLAEDKDTWLHAISVSMPSHSLTDTPTSLDMTVAWSITTKQKIDPKRSSPSMPNVARQYDTTTKACNDDSCILNPQPTHKRWNRPLVSVSEALHISSRIQWETGTEYWSLLRRLSHGVLEVKNRGRLLYWCHVYFGTCSTTSSLPVSSHQRFSRYSVCTTSSSSSGNLPYHQVRHDRNIYHISSCRETSIENLW